MHATQRRWRRRESPSRDGSVAFLIDAAISQKLHGSARTTRTGPSRAVDRTVAVAARAAPRQRREPVRGG